MPKPSTGIFKTKSAKRLDLSFLLQNGYIKKGKSLTGSLKWESNGDTTLKAELTTYYEQFQKMINLKYSLDGQSYDMSIELSTKPSNLKKGETLYFVCPVTEQRCRVLYMAYGLPAFISRVAYHQMLNRRIYYDGQACSKQERLNTRYWNLENQIEQENTKRRALNYAGKPTRRYTRMEKLIEQRDSAEILRWGADSLNKRLYDVSLDALLNL